MDRDNNFNLIRLLAAYQVLYNHAVNHLQTEPLRGWPVEIITALPGVPIFFIVSGFLVTQSYIASRDNADYFWRRSLRIYPALWVHFVVILVLLAIFGAWKDGGLDLRWLATALLTGSDWWGNIAINAQAFDWGAFYQRFPSGVLWTISVELGFYLLVPFVFAKALRASGMVWPMIALCAGLSVFFAFELKDAMATAPGANATGYLHNGPLPYFWVFLLGATLALLWKHVSRVFVGAFGFWLTVYVAAAVVDAALFGHRGIKMSNMTPMDFLKMAALAGAVLSFAYSMPSLGRLFQRFDASYGVYLYHMPIFATLAGLGMTGSWLLALLAPFAAGAASWFLIERPALKLKSARLTLPTWRRRPAARRSE